MYCINGYIEQKNTHETTLGLLVEIEIFSGYINCDFPALAGL